VIVIALILGIALISLTGCAKEENTVTENNTSEGNTMSENTSSSERVVDTIDYESAAEKQMAMPEVGDTVAIFHIKNYGDIKVKFFEEVAPKAVENFITHAKEGYYDGLIFHRVIDEFMIQGGDPEGTGYGGESIWGEGFGTELDYELVPYRGSLCMAMSSQPNSIGSQFFITQANYSESQESYLKSAGYPEKLLDVYKKEGGYLSLYLQYTVFGQVYEGMDIVDKIAEVETDSNDKPLEDVVIESIEITEYK
jgi:cyclophilin family peptidyl-prolyl cis-trans isomerase